MSLIRYEEAFGLQDTFDEVHRLKLVLIESGAGIITIGGRKLAFTAPMLLCLSPGDQIELILNSNLKAKAFHFHPLFINRALSLEILEGGDDGLSETDLADIRLLWPFLRRNDIYFGQLDIEPEVFERVSGLFEAIDHDLRKAKGKHQLCMVRAHVLELLFLLENLRIPYEADSIRLADGQRQDMRQVLHYLHMNYQCKIAIPELCAAFHVNRTTLQKQFQEVAGISILAYLIRLRIRLSAILLRDTGLPIYEIVRRLGFKDNAHFTKMFRKRMGCTPNEYRQAYFKVWKGEA